MKEFKYEIYISIGGATLSVIQFFINPEFSFLILAFTIVLDIAIFGIKSDMRTHINSVDKCQRLIFDIHNKRWRDAAEKLLNETLEQIKSISDGTRMISLSNINNEELALMESAQKSIKCIYYAESLVKLKMRLPDSIYNPLYSVLTGYSDKKYKKLEKKRIIIIGNNIDITKEETKEFLKKINAFNRGKINENGLEFDIRFLLFSKLTELQIPLIGNLLLVDNIEATTVVDKTVYPDDYLEKNTQILRDLDCRATINQVEIKRLQDIFQRMWEIALDIEHFLA